jgi:hypothetical protein
VSHGTSAASRGTSAEWCGVVWNAAFRKNVQTFAAFCGLFAYAADLRRNCHGVKVGIHGLSNWTAENLFLGCEKMMPANLAGCCTVLTQRAESFVFFFRQKKTVLKCMRSQKILNL